MVSVFVVGSLNTLFSAFYSFLVFSCDVDVKIVHHKLLSLCRKVESYKFIFSVIVCYVRCAPRKIVLFVSVRWP